MHLKCLFKSFLLFLFFFIAESPFSYSQVFWEATNYSSEQPVIINSIVFVGNNVTREKIIYRELIFHKDDTLKSEVLKAAAERSQENLMNTLLFNFVEVHVLTLYDNHLDITIVFKERWYIFILPIVELADRNINVWWQTKDWSRINYGFNLTWNNFRGRREVFQTSLKLGYSQKFNISYSIPYINRSQKDGITFSAGFNRNHEIAYTLDESQLVYYKNENLYTRNEYFGSLKYGHRDKFDAVYSFFGSYNYATTYDTVQVLNPDYFYNQASFQQYISLGFNYRIDKRDYKIYALHGDYFEFEISKVGLGVLKNEPSLIYALLQYKKYFEFKKSRWHYSFSAKGRLNSLEDAPYYNQKALGYQNDFVRSYEYYVVNGQSYFLFKHGIKFTVIKPNKFVIPYLKTEKFNTVPYAVYLELFNDWGYVVDNRFPETNPKANTWTPGVGLGLNFVTYYNIVGRFEYAINRYGEDGFFLHLGAAF